MLFLQFFFFLLLNFNPFSSNRNWHPPNFTIDELLHVKEKYKNIADEMDKTFAELAGY
jgi:hypothetical protein